MKQLAQVIKQITKFFRSNTLSHRILSGGFWVLLGKLIAIPIGLLITAYVRRLLPIELVGSYVLIETFIVIGVLFVSLGFDQALIRFIAQEGVDKKSFLHKNLPRLFAIIGIAALVLSILYIFLARWVSTRFFADYNLTPLILIMALLVFLLAIQRILAESFRGFQDLHLASLLTGTKYGVLTSFLFLIAILVLYFNKQASLTIVLLCLAIACIVSIGLAVFLMFKRLSSLNSETSDEISDSITETSNDNALGSLWKIAWPLWISNLITLGFIAQLDVWVVSAYFTDVDTGIYGTARNLVHYVLLPLVIVNMVVPPIIAQLYAKKDLGGLERTLQTTATVAGIPAFLAVLGVIFFAKPVLTLLGGSEQYALGSTVLIIMSLGQLVNVFSGSCMPALAMTGHQRYNLIISIIVGVFTVAAYFLIVPRFGLVGAAIVAALTLCLRNGLATYFVKQKLGIWVFADLRKLKDAPKLLKSVLGNR